MWKSVAFPALLAVMLLSGCSIVNRSLMHNDTKSPIFVGIYEERRDFGWEARRYRTLQVAPGSICKLQYDIYYQTHIAIEDSNGKVLTRLGLLREELMTYSLVQDSAGPYVVQHESPIGLTKKLYKGLDNCIAVDEETLTDLFYFRPRKEIEDDS